MFHKIDSSWKAAEVSKASAWDDPLHTVSTDLAMRGLKTSTCDDATAPSDAPVLAVADRPATGRHLKYFRARVRGRTVFRCTICRKALSHQISLQKHTNTVHSTWDRFYKAPFRPKTFRINFSPQILDKLHQKQHGYINSSEYNGP
jgi:hypothetical protein